MTLEEPHRRYAVRMLEKPTREAEAQVQALAQWNGTEKDPTPAESVRLARQWYDALQEALLSLRDFPHRCPLIPERSVFGANEVHQLLFRRAPSAPVWRMLFVIEEEGEDGPTVQVIHLRAGAQRPLTRKTAREIPLHDEGRLEGV